MKSTIKAIIFVASIAAIMSTFTSCTCTSSTGMHTRQYFQNNGGCEWHRN